MDSNKKNGLAESPLLNRLMEALRCLPGVGPKTSQRMAFHLLQNDRDRALKLADVIKQAVNNIGSCEKCRTLTENKLCSICLDSSRRKDLLCIVESPADVFAIETCAEYRGQYFVLMGKLSPLDGIGPEEIGLDLLEKRLDSDALGELILATNSTVEGEVTAHVISEMARKRSIKTTRIAQGVPLGGELEYMDSNTLAHAFSGRRDY